MSDARLDKVEIYHADRNELVREGIRTAFRAAGIKQISTFATVEGLRNALKKNAPDLLIASDDLGKEILQTVRDIRQSKCGVNPFLLVTLTVASDSFTGVKKAIASGADDVVTGPIVPGVLLRRAIFLARHRPFFIATADYLGPERRRTAPGRLDIPHVEAVNTFQAKLDGTKKTYAAVQREIREGIKAVMAARLDSEGRKLAWACHRIIRAYEEGRVEKEVEELLLTVVRTLKDAADVATTLRKRELRKVAADLAAQLESSCKHFDALTEQELSVLRKLAKSYQEAQKSKNKSP